VNFLAHTYLSGDSTEIRMGNIIGDYVKGNQFNQYPELIRKGILMHRDIDSFTDSHPLVKQTNKFFTERYRKYSGIVTDIFFDHFLANHWSLYSPIDFSEYVKGIYFLIKGEWKWLPEEMHVFASSCMENNWIKSYARIDGIEHVLYMMSLRTSLPDESLFAGKVLRENYAALESLFLEFFPQLIQFIESKHSIPILQLVPKE
jgi:acyl carrier protein phosphodiesterase